jgi:hypothetical protein
MGAGCCCCCWSGGGEVATPPDCADAGGPGNECIEAVLSARGWKWAPIAVFSSCCTTGLMESRCSAKLALDDAGASRMFNFSEGTMLCRCARKAAASLSVHK